LTVHWRKFIRPLMWRCKWIELQIKELQSQALKYDSELAVYDQRKQLEFQNFTLDDIDAKSLPFSSQILRKKVMKRKKRKRVEETIDITTYMSQHNLFSYYGMKLQILICAVPFFFWPSISIIHGFPFSFFLCFPGKKRSAADAAPMEDDCGNLCKKY
jgi:hypothetical protein